MKYKFGSRILIVLILAVMLSGCGNGSSSSTPTAAAPTREFTADSNTVALWHFNESSGTTVADSSATGGFPLTFVSDIAVPVLPAFTDSGHTGFGNAFSVTAANKQSAKTSSSMSGLFAAHNISVEFWVKFSSLVQEPPLFLGEDFTFRIFIRDTGKIHVMFGSPSGWGDLYSTNALTADTWHYIVCTNDGITKQVTIYIDGSPDSNIVPGPTDVFLNFDTIPAVHIGGFSGATYWFTGQLDEMRVSNSVRTAAEILNYYNRTILP
jgi:hypothetical protein